MRCNYWRPGLPTRNGQHGYIRGTSRGLRRCGDDRGPSHGRFGQAGRAGRNGDKEGRTSGERQSSGQIRRSWLPSGGSPVPGSARDYNTGPGPRVQNRTSDRPTTLRAAPGTPIAEALREPAATDRRAASRSSTPRPATSAHRADAEMAGHVAERRPVISPIRNCRTGVVESRQSIRRMAPVSALVAMWAYRAR